MPYHRMSYKRPPKRYTLDEAGRYLSIDAPRLREEAEAGRIRHYGKGRGSEVTFSESQLLAYQGYIPISSAKQYVMEKCGKAATLSADEIVWEGIRRGELGTRRVYPEDKPWAQRVIYVEEKSLESLVRKVRREKYCSFEDGLEYLQERLKEKGFDKGAAVRRNSEIQREIFRKRGITFPVGRDKMCELIDNYVAIMYDANTYFHLGEAALVFLQKAREANVPLKGEATFLHMRERLQRHIEKGMLPTEKFLNPQDGRYSLCVRKEELEKFVKGYLSEKETKAEERIRRLKRSHEHKEIMGEINYLRKQVARAASVRLPERIFISKPEGHYGSISYPDEEEYRTGKEEHKTMEEKFENDYQTLAKT